MKDLNKIEDYDTDNINNLSEEEILHLKAQIKQGIEDIKNGNFITHEEMLLELKRKKII